VTELPGELRDTARGGARQPSSCISPAVRITGLVVGFALAIAATLAVFLTEDAVVLRLAVIAVAWAFVIAAFSAGRRKTDQAVAEGRESELRQAYALELEREVAARREYELKLENQLRRETQEAMRAELDKLRADLASLAGLRDQLSGLGELRADMGRLRAELTEQLSGEMLVERIVMRTQSIRMPTELGASAPLAIDGQLPDWVEPAVDDAVAPLSAPPPPPSAARPVVGDPPTAEQPRVVLPQVAVPPVPEAAPRADQRAEPEPEPRPVAPATALWETARDEDTRHHRRAPEEPPPAPAPPLHEPDVFETAGHQRLTEILAESGSTLGGRRRRRHREDGDGEGDGGDDVLARILNR
jgi:hypothetical protein